MSPRLQMLHLRFAFAALLGLAWLAGAMATPVPSALAATCPALSAQATGDIGVHREA